MAEPFLGEIRLAGFSIAPKGWALCDGQMLPINQNQALFSLLGTTYGGDGRTNFGLPNLRGRVPIHFGDGRSMGEAAGEEFHTLTVAEMPAHSHSLLGTTTDASQVVPNGNLLGSYNNGYGAPASLVSLANSVVVGTGGNQPHENRSPYLVVNYIIALQGIFPSPN